MTSSTGGRAARISGRHLAILAVCVAAALTWFVRPSADSPAHDGSDSSQDHTRGGNDAESALAAPVSSSVARVPTELDTLESVAAPSDPTTHTENLALHVEVVDGRGNAVEGVPISVLRVIGEDVLARGTTDVEGRTTLAVDPRDLPYKTTLRVGALLLTRTPNAIEFPASSWPEQPVRLVAEPTGSIELSFGSSAPYPLDADAFTRLIFDDERCSEDMRRALHESYADWDIDARTLRIPHVGLGLCLIADCNSRGLEFEDVPFDGPQHAGELVRVEVPFVRAQTRWIGRVVDRDGAVLAHHDVEVTTIADVDTHRSPGQLFEERADADGRFEAFVSARRAERATARLAIEARRGGRSTCTGSAAWSGVFDPSVPGEFVTVDLGDIVLDAPPHLASGRVVNPHDEPFAPWNEVTIEVRSIDPPSISSSWSATNAQVARDGSFRFGHTYPLRRFELRARAYDRVPSEPVAASPGEEGLLLRLREGERVAGRILVPEGIDAHDFDLDFECIDPPNSPDHRVGAYETFDDGRFLTRSIAPGRYSVTLSYLERELGRREFDVRESKDLLELDPFDLRTLVHPVRIHVTGRDGAVIDSGSATFTVDDGEEGGANLDRDGRAVLCALTPMLDVVVAAPGFAAELFPGVTTGAELALSPGLPVRVAVRDLPAAPEHCEYDVGLQPTDAGPVTSHLRAVHAPIDARGFASLILPCEGMFRLTVSLHQTGERSLQPVLVRHDVRIDRSSGESVPTIECVFELTPESWQKTLDDLRQR